MKKALAIVLSVLLMLPAGAAFAVNANLHATVQGIASATEIDEGEEFTITVQFVSDQPVYTYELIGTYDTELATLVSSEAVGTRTDSNQAVNIVENGTFHLINTVDQAAADGVTDIYRFTFRAGSQSGTFQMNITTATLMHEVPVDDTDSFGGDYTFTVDSQQVDWVNIGDATPSPTPTRNPGGGGGSSGSGGNGPSGGGNTGGTPIIGGGGTTSPSASPDASGADEKFTDLGGFEWARDAVYTLNERGIILGTSDTTFSPQENIKRGDYMLILSRMMEINDAFTENFADVPADSYYYNAIGSARAAGVAQGDGEYFYPEDAITREDLITLAYRILLGRGLIAATEDYTSLDQFNDKDMISDYAQAPMAAMVAQGIIQGSDDGGVNPLGQATRAEVAVMCARILNLLS